MTALAFVADAPQLAEAQRNALALSRHLEPVLRAVVAGETDVRGLARAAGITEPDCRRALFFLESLELVESTRYVATASGRRALA